MLVPQRASATSALSTGRPTARRRSELASARYAPHVTCASYPSCSIVPGAPYITSAVSNTAAAAQTDVSQRRCTTSPAAAPTAQINRYCAPFVYSFIAPEHQRLVAERGDFRPW